jgi:hypothetical protein
MATLTTQNVSLAGIVDVIAGLSTAAGGGDKVRPGPNVFLYVQNGDASSKTVTIDDPNSRTPVAAAAFNPDVAVVVAAGKEAMIGPITDRFANSSDGLAAITYSAVTAVKVGAFQV